MNYGSRKDRLEFFSTWALHTLQFFSVNYRRIWRRSCCCCKKHTMLGNKLMDSHQLAHFCHVNHSNRNGEATRKSQPDMSLLTMFWKSIKKSHFSGEFQSPKATLTLKSKLKNLQNETLFCNFQTPWRSTMTNVLGFSISRTSYFCRAKVPLNGIKLLSLVWVRRTASHLLQDDKI